MVTSSVLFLLAVCCQTLEGFEEISSLKAVVQPTTPQKLLQEVFSNPDRTSDTSSSRRILLFFLVKGTRRFLRISWFSERPVQFFKPEDERKFVRQNRGPILVWIVVYPLRSRRVSRDRSLILPLHLLPVSSSRLPPNGGEMTNNDWRRWLPTASVLLRPLLSQALHFFG